MGSIVSRDELRRLEKAAKDKNKAKLADWIKQFEYYLDSLMRKDYEKACYDEVMNHYDNILTAVAYTAYFSEESYVGKGNLADFMADLFTTIDMFRTGEYTPQEYKDILKGEGVTIDDYDSDLIYKKYLNIFDTDLVKFLKTKHTKIVTICGAPKFKDDILTVNEDLTVQNYMVFINTVLQQGDDIKLLKEEVKQLETLQCEKILISDILYVVNKDGYIDDETKVQIEFAKEHNKEIKYLEDIKE